MKRIFNARPIHWVFWLSMIALGIFFLLGNTNTASPNLTVAMRGFGQTAWYLLVFTIYISLLTRLFPSQLWLARLFALRKHTGIAAFLFAIAHLLGDFWRTISFGSASLANLVNQITAPTNTRVFGWLALLLLVPAFATSCAWAIKKLGFARWKVLQRLVHIAFVFTALHVALLRFFAGGQIDFEPVVTVMVYVSGYLYLLVKLERQRHKKIFRVIGPMVVAIICLFSSSTALAGDATGADGIFLEIGQIKPTDWSSWDRESKFDYLQSMGIKPGPDGKYRGSTGDLKEYFDWLGTSVPINWDSLNAEERQSFVESLKISPAPDNQLTKDISSPNSWLKLYLITVGLVMGVGLMLASYKVDWLRQNKKFE
ncbi:MAG: ferric reductase-like transmembrane domain-containing protein [Patescibacteria group bacterium]